MKTLDDLTAERIEHDRTASVLDHGHQLVGLMAEGDGIYCSGEWRTIAKIGAAGSGRVRLVMADGTEYVAAVAGTRRHRCGEQAA